MTEPKTIGRRGAMKRALTVLGAAAVAPTLLSACGGEESGGGGGGGGGELTCTDTTGLPPAAVQMRQSQHYVDSSPNPEQNCANCNFFSAGQAGQCGTCTVVQGPIHPDGYCDLWAAQA